MGDFDGQVEGSIGGREQFPPSLPVAAIAMTSNLVASDNSYLRVSVGLEFRRPLAKHSCGPHAIPVLARAGEEGFMGRS